MNKLAWGDTLCGKVITPASWQRGITEHLTNGEFDPHERGEWGIFTTNPCLGVATIQKLYRPIFPPRGWAGKSDAELWHAVWQIREYMAVIAAGEDWEISFEPCAPKPYIAIKCGSIQFGETEYTNTAVIEPCELDGDQARALQLAIANALVLHARLSEVAA